MTSPRGSTGYGHRVARRDAGWADQRASIVQREDESGDITLRGRWGQQVLICQGAGQGPMVVVDVKGLEPMASRV